jgi:hypothetical protein
MSWAPAMPSPTPAPIAPPARTIDPPTRVLPMSSSAAIRHLFACVAFELCGDDADGGDCAVPVPIALPSRRADVAAAGLGRFGTRV